MNRNNLEDIGKAAITYYQANQKRLKARTERAKAFKEHLCEREVDDGDGHFIKSPCYYEHYLRLHFKDWCDDCKYTQPFHEAYLKSAQEARVAKNKLTHLIKRGTVKE